MFMCHPFSKCTNTQVLSKTQRSYCRLETIWKHLTNYCLLIGVFLTMASSGSIPKPQTAGALDQNIDFTRFSTREPDTRGLPWSNIPLVAFLNASSATSPCLTTGNKDDWVSFRNNNICSVWLIGRIKVLQGRYKPEDLAGYRWHWWKCERAD